jgi:spore coat polysaccharide biosynthesis predicted glycosyltransferase SpsG
VKTILFRADANSAIGTGDLISLIHLSGYLDLNYWQILFMVKEDPCAMNILKRYGISKVCKLPCGLSLSQELSLMEEFCANQKVDVVFLEITAHPIKAYSQLRGGQKRACIAFDQDIPETGFDLVVSWDIQPKERINATGKPQTGFLLGPEYTVLPQSFINLKRQKKTHKDGSQKLLVALGGADREDFTYAIAQSLITLDLNLEITFIVGAAYENHEGLQRVLDKSDNEHRILCNIQNMLQEYLACDLAIGSGGLTVAELIATQTPCLILATYRHQVHRCEFYAKQGLISYLGYRSFNEEQLISFIKNPKVPTSHFHFQPMAIVEALQILVSLQQ